MSINKRVGDPISHLDGVPDGLTALQVNVIVTDGGGQQRIRTDRRGKTVTREVALVAGEVIDPDQPARDHGHAAVRTALATATRRHTAARHELGIALARAGLVELRAPLTTTRAGLEVNRWTRWNRTADGAEHAAIYDTSQCEDLLLVGYATEQADQETSPGWPQRFDDAYRHATTAAQRAVTLTRTGDSDGWPLSRFARETVLDTHGLDRDASLTRIVSAAVAAAHGTDPASPWDQVWFDAGLAVDVLASVVVCAGVPAGGEGPAAQMLRAGRDGLPVTVSRQRLAADPAPVGPPPEGHPGWVFAVENEAVLSWAWRTCPQTPVVWHGSDAAALLLQAATSAGWRVALSADFEPGGLARAASLLSRLPDAVPWRLSSRDYLNHLDRGTGAPIGSRKVTTPWDPPLGELLAKLKVRLTEEDRFDQLADDLKAGVPQLPDPL